MPTYIYTAKNKEGETKTGHLETTDQHKLAILLRDQGLSTPDSFEWELCYSDVSEPEVRGVSVNFIEQLESE